MSKRRRPCSLPVYAESDSLDGDEASTSGGPPANKRRKLFDPIEICQQLVELMRNRKKPDGTLLSESFIRIPKRRQEPAYYDVVSNPIDLIKVQQKLKMDEYEDVEDLQADVELMVDNAKAFYKRNTQEYKDAVELLELFYANKNRLLQEPTSKKPLVNNKRRSNNNNNNGTKTPSPRPPDRRPLRNKPKIPYTPNNTTRRRKLVERTPSSSSASSSSEENEESSEQDSDAESASDEEDDSCPFEELMEAVMEARDEHRKLLHPPFQLLPSRKKYPDYYEVVEQPVDLKMVTSKIRRGKYKFLFELEKDLLLMCKNACLYNEPGSQIYKQAKALRKFVQAKRIEIDTRRGTLPIMATPNSARNNKTGSNRTSLNSSRTGSNSRSFKSSRSPSVTRSNSVTPVSLASGRHSLNSLGSRNNLSLNRSAGAGVRVYKNNSRSNRSSATPSPAPSPLRERDGFNLRNKRTPRSFKDQDSDFDEDEFYDPSDPQWRLFETVRSATGYNGTMMSEPFRRLPSRKSYPDYYKEIKNPICLDQIRRKLVKKGYGNLSELAGDLTIMFENAKKYNVPTSKLYKDAVKLQKLMQTKVEELLDVDQLFTEKELIRRKPGPKPKYQSPLPRGRPPKDPTLVKKRLHMLAKYMLDYTTEDGRKPMLAFIEKPSRKLYPAYYDVIAEPIDFLEIERKIKSEQYANVGDLVEDFRLMFANCRQFNEENSPIYEDANLLEQYLLDEVESWKRTNSSGRTPDKRKERVVLKPYKPRRILSPLEKSLKQLYESIRYYRHPTDDRLLSPAFMKLPSKLDYPDYYEVIPQPIDLDRIDRKNKAGEYQTIDELATDLALLLDNACRYNEPGSQLYKDALTLRRQLFNTKMQLQLKEDENAVPDVAFIVQDILLTLFANVYGYQDERGRCCSDSMADLPEHDIIEGVRTRALSLDLIKRRLDKGLYKRLDAFQEDFFACMERARRLSRTDSQVFQDAVELQLYFIKQRDELCNNGDLLSSPALIYTEIDAKASIDDIRAEKAMKESLSLIDEEEPETPSRSSSENSILIVQKDEESNTNPISTNKDDENSVESSIMSMESVRIEESNTNNIKKDSEDNNVKEEESKIDENSVNNTKECESESIEENAKESEKNVNAKETEEDTSTKNNNSVVAEKPLDQEPDKSKNPECNGSNSSESTVLSVTNKDDTLVNKNPLPGAVVSEPSELSSEHSSNNSDYRIGDFVYVNSSETKESDTGLEGVKEEEKEWGIVCIERLWTSGDRTMMYGNRYFRPDETYHLSTRRFLEKEVFKSDKYASLGVDEIVGKCCVVHVKQYFTMKPEGYDDKDVYVCESRYRTRSRTFKKIKIYPENPTIKLVPREVPLSPKRVISVFRERIEKHKDELQELEDLEKLVEKEKPNVMAYNNMDIDDGNTYYEQFNTVCSGVIKTGDYVYVVADGGKQVVAQIDSIWETKDGKCYFRGPWFISPSEVPHNPNRMFYKNEIFLSSLEDVSPIVSIIGRCHVLELNDWVIYRPTEIPECDVFICTSAYDEINRQLKRLPAGGLKKYTHSPLVTEDEIYFFKRSLIPPKEIKIEPAQIKIEPVQIRIDHHHSPVKIEPCSPQLSKMSDMDVTMDDSLDGGPPSVGSGDIPVAITAPATPATASATPVSTSKKKSNKNKVVTGYILYSREVRKQVVQNNPESTFGDISRIVGSEWKSLPQSEKQHWEEKASKLNEETKALLLLEQEQCGSPAPAPPPPDQIFECLWDNCDYQFEEASDLIDHCIKDKDTHGHVQAFYQENAGADFNCHWRNCNRVKKNLQPFPSITRLIRHVRDMHINKGNGRSVAPENRSKNFKPSSKPPPARPTSSTSSSATPNATATSTFNTSNGIVSSNLTVSSTNVLSPNGQKPQEPMFVSVPPRPQRVLHSEAYIKYIEGLTTENKHLSQWERTLHASQENTPEPDSEKLKQVSQWLGRKTDQHDNVVAALWTLRNQLLKDTLSLHKTL